MIQNQPNSACQRWAVVPASQLSETHCARWRGLIEDGADFDSPYFSPEYVQAIAADNPHIEVGFLNHGDQAVAVFPFERLPGDIAGPVGRELADYQGPIYRQHTELNVFDMLEQLKLNRWHFDHLYPLRPCLANWCWMRWPSPQIDWRAGVASVSQAFEQQHKRLLASLGRKEKKLRTLHGSVSHVNDLRDPDLLVRLLDWKSAQYEEAGRQHPFRQEWVRRFLAQTLARDDAHFCGRMSALLAGERAVAIEFSLQSHSVSHMLVCAHDSESATFSPGLMRNAKLMDAGHGQRIAITDFGKGIEEYKRTFMNSVAEVGEGAVDRRLLRNYLQSTMQRSRYRFLQSPLSNPVRQLARFSASRLPFVRRLLSMR